MDQASGPETSEISFRLGTRKKQRLHELAHELSSPGETRVTASDLCRTAVNQFLACYDGDDPSRCDAVENGQIGVDPSDVDLPDVVLAEEP